MPLVVGCSAMPLGGDGGAMPLGGDGGVDHDKMVHDDWCCDDSGKVKAHDDWRIKIRGDNVMFSLDSMYLHV
ncbi:hypothetical protein TRIUR3_25213 [Triticum urartu]|uniref:Uncharacterized protein n=1 Tax=Triticum urartu TaxID=4572 RepID=M8B233_TRIUA|nr:hypothetical protein TRIUR3_25213 [Triticum urartu]